MRRNRRKKSTKSYNYNIKKISLFLIIIILLIFLILISIINPQKNNSLKIAQKEYLEVSQINDNIEKILFGYKKIEEVKENQVDPKDEPITFTMTAIGDILCHNTQYFDAYIKETNEYDFSYVFEDISYYTKVSDITIGNLETTFAGEDKGYSNYPTFNTPDSLANALKKIGVNVITLAGNHALDFGFDGLCRTIDVFDSVDISHLGTYKTSEEQEKILIKNVKGVNIAFINYTYGTNGIPVPFGKEFCVNLIDRDLIRKQIDQAKEQNVDMIVACMHWGTEYKTTANSDQKELADFLFENGVDIIIGNHPHVLQPMEKRSITLEDGTVKDVFVIYALGNFTADQRDEITRNSAILNLSITKNLNGKISINKVDYVPIYMYKNQNAKVHKFKILDIEKSLLAYESGDTSVVDFALYNKLQIQLDKIRSILGDELN